MLCVYGFSFYNTGATPVFTTAKFEDNFEGVDAEGLLCIIIVSYFFSNINACGDFLHTVLKTLKKFISLTYF